MSDGKNIGKKLFLHASLTAEASFVVSLSVFALFVFLYMFIFLHTEFIVYQSMMRTADEIYGYGTVLVYGEKTISKSGENMFGDYEVPEFIKEMLRKTTGNLYAGHCIEDYFDESGRNLSCVKGGTEGIDTSGSCLSTEGGYILLKAHYIFEFPIAVFNLENREVNLKLKTGLFTGVDWDSSEEFEADEQPNDNDTETTYAYIAKNGSVYHLDENCTYIHHDIKQATISEIKNLRNSGGAKYYPCAYCNSGAFVNVVYYTEYGTRYHTLSGCPQIEKNVEKVTEEEAVGRGFKACSKCGE